MARTLFDANSFLFLAARLPQIYKNWRSRSTGELSLLTCLMNLAGCTARIFTSLQEGAGSAMVRAFVLGIIFNSILVAQILMWGNRPAAAGAAAAAKKAGAGAKKKA
jgi:mannose-P-dolichol utilization defect protein 1